jgi:uncharacterized protein (TIGR03067 family)
MFIHSTVKTFAALAGILLIGGAGPWWVRSPGNEAPEQKKDAPIVAEAQPISEPAKKDNKTELPKKERPETNDDAAKAEAEKVKAQLEQLKGTWKVVYSEGEPPAVKLPKGAKLRKPAFYMIDKDHLTWDNGNPDDPDRLVRFHARYPHEQDWLPFDVIDIGRDNTFLQTDTVYGRYAFVGERLRIRWSVADRPWSVSTQLFWEKPSYSILLQRADANDPQAVAKEKAAAAPELQSLQGRWRITKVVGAPDYYTEVGHDFLFQGDRLKILSRDTDDVRHSFNPILLQIRTSPKQIILFNDDGDRTYSGVYRHERDRLDICWRVDRRGPYDDEKKDDNGGAPNKFEVGKDSKTIQLIRLERVDAAAEQAAAEKTRLADLQKAVVATLQNEVIRLYATRFPSDSSDTILWALGNLKDAQLALARDKISRLQITESYLQHLVAIEALRKAEREAGETAAHEVAQVKAKRLMAELLLEIENGRKTDAPSAADAPAKKSTTNMGDKHQEEARANDELTAAEKERAKAELEQRMKGTWRVVYSEGELPTVKLRTGEALKKPAFYLIDNDHVTWDNGDPDDPARLVRFHMRYPDGSEIEISQNDRFPKAGSGFWASRLGRGDPLLSTQNTDDTAPQAETIYGRYAFVGEKLRLCWSTAGHPDTFSTKQFLEKINYSVILQRVDANDPQTAAREKAGAAPELQLLQGRWRITKVVGAQDDDAKVGHDFLFQDDRLKILWRDIDDIARSFGPIVLTTGANPKQIAFFNDEKPFAKSGIYRLENDRLEICWRVDNRDGKGESPRMFEASNVSKTIQLIQLERIDAAADKTRPLNLQKALVESLQARVTGIERGFRRQRRFPNFVNGAEPRTTLLEAAERLIETQLALATDKKSRIQVLDSYLQRLLRYERDFKADNRTDLEMTQVKANRLMAEILLEKEKGQAADKMRLVDLQKALVETLQAQVNGIENEMWGEYSIITFLQAAEKLMEAQLAIATDKKSRIQVMESYLKRLLGYENTYLKYELFGGKHGPIVYGIIKAKRLMAEILLEKEKGK